MIPNEQSFCEIDPDVKDKWGIPVLRFHWQWSDHELNQVRHMQTTFRQILETMGGTINVPGQVEERGAAPAAAGAMGGAGASSPPPAPPAAPSVPISVGGGIIHEVGTVRMGDDPKNERAEQVLPGARRPEPVRRRRRLRSSATPTRTRRTRSSRSRGARRSTSRKK